MMVSMRVGRIRQDPWKTTSIVYVRGKKTDRAVSLQSSEIRRGARRMIGGSRKGEPRRFQLQVVTVQVADGQITGVI